MQTVLLVEDQEDNRIIYSTYLDRSGYRVLEAVNGAEGVRLAQSERPDLILMDISMPIMDGLEATRLLKSDPETSGIPIIALTAHAMRYDRDTVMAAGCDAYVAKPAEPRAVVDVVERWIGRSQ